MLPDQRLQFLLMNQAAKLTEKLLPLAALKSIIYFNPTETDDKGPICLIRVMSANGTDRFLSIHLHLAGYEGSLFKKQYFVNLE